jgi:hypothetical protein
MSDFGARMRMKLSLALGVALVAVAGCGKPVEVAAGPPCPSVDAATFASYLYQPKPKMALAYGGATFGRALGNASCEEVADGGLGFKKHPVCDFTSPAVLEVKMDGGEHSYYTPAVGQPVRITIRDGKNSCELVPKS